MWSFQKGKRKGELREVLMFSLMVTDVHLVKLNAQTTAMLLFLTLVVLDYLWFDNEIQ